MTEELVELLECPNFGGTWQLWKDHKFCYRITTVTREACSCWGKETTVVACTCDGYNYRGKCKHMDLVALMLRKKEAEDGKDEDTKEENDDAPLPEGEEEGGGDG